LKQQAAPARGSSERRPPLRAVIFDLFDTLVDLHMENVQWEEFRGMSIPTSTRRLHAAVAERAEVDFEAFAEALIQVSREARETHYLKDLEYPTRDRFDALLSRLGVADSDLSEALTQLHMGEIRAAVEIPEHHVRTLDRLGRRASLALCSNFSHAPTARRVLEDAGMRHQLDAIVVSEEVGIRKPRGEIFQAVLEALGVEPGEALHVGDSLRADVAGAAFAGIRTVWLTRRVPDPERSLAEYDGPPPDWRIGDLEELVALVEEL
jgi:putative hydrolase of the HAD superfamily